MADFLPTRKKRGLKSFTGNGSMTGLTKEQLIERKRGLGGSDAAAVLGLNPYRTPLDVYLEKRDEVEPADLSDVIPVQFGIHNEDFVGLLYERHTGAKLVKPRAIRRHKRYPWMLGNFDRLIKGTRQGLEIKTASSRQAHKWGQPGTDQVPEEYLMQCLHYIEVSGYGGWDLAVLIDNADFRIYHVERDAELSEMLIEAERDFWQRVLDGNPPDPITLADAGKLYRIEKGETVTADDGLVRQVNDLRELKTWLKEAKQKADDLELEIKKAMGNAVILADQYGAQLATWKSQTSRRLDSKAAQAALGQELAPYITETTSRVFRLR